MSKLEPLVERFRQDDATGWLTGYRFGIFVDRRGHPGSFLRIMRTA